MSLSDAVKRTGPIPPKGCTREESKAYAETLSYNLAREVASSLRRLGFDPVRPEADGPGERAFQGGLGPKKLDVTHSDERNGLLLAVSIKSITKAPFEKNLTNRFADLCTESINMHMRFPYAVVGALFVFPDEADTDTTKKRKESTFRRAMRLFGNLTGRAEYNDAPEKFEDVTMMLFCPKGPSGEPVVRLFDITTGKQILEPDYFKKLKEIYKRRNPHLLAADLDLPEASEEDSI